MSYNEKENCCISEKVLILQRTSSPEKVCCNSELLYQKICTRMIKTFVPENLYRALLNTIGKKMKHWDDDCEQ